MPRPYSDDLRMHAVKKLMTGESCRRVAKQLQVAASSVIKWVGAIWTRDRSGRAGWARRTPKLAGPRSWFLDRINACLAVTLAGLQDWLGEQCQ